MTDAVNPLLTPSPLPFDFPDWPAIEAEHYLPAFEQAFAEHRAEIDAITRVRSMPTFENTMVALERAGALLERVAHIFYTVSSADATEQIQAIDAQLAPLMSAHEDAIRLDEHLYWRVKTLHDRLDDLGLGDEDRYLVQRHFREMTHAGAGLDDAAKRRVTEINQELSTLTSTFERNLLADTNELAVHFADAAALDGLSEGELSAAAQAATDRGMDGFLVSLPLFSGHPYLAHLTDRESRRRIMAASRSRAARRDDHDNRSTLLRIVRLRAERARLLGHPSHAAYVTADETAGSAEAVSDLLHRLAAPAARNAATEQRELQRLADAEAAACGSAPFQL